MKNFHHTFRSEVTRDLRNQKFKGVKFIIVKYSRLAFCLPVTNIDL